MQELSNFKSAILWPDLDQEQPTEELVPFSRALSLAMDGAAESFTMAGITDSPIEAMFGARLSLHLRKLCGECDLSFGVKDGPADILLAPQYPIGRFRYDFALLVRGQPAIVIECDGKQFHSTNAQIANDDLKNQFALDAGITVLRFTGSEIHRDSDRCVRAVISSLSERTRIV